MACTTLGDIPVVRRTNMPRGPADIDIERGQILSLHRECVSFQSIAGLVNRCEGAIQRAARQGFKHKPAKQWKGNKKISETQKRAVIRMALKGEDSENDKSRAETTDRK